MGNDEPSFVPALPPLPPLPGVAIPPEIHAPGTPTTLADATPLLQSTIALQQQGSGVSSLTNALTAASALMRDDRDIECTSKRGKRNFPDFLCPISLDNQDLSGDNSDGWLEEEEAIAKRISVRISPSPQKQRRTTATNNNDKQRQQQQTTKTTACDALKEDVQCIDPLNIQQPTRNSGREEMVAMMTATTPSTKDNDKQRRKQQTATHNNDYSV